MRNTSQAIGVLSIMADKITILFFVFAGSCLFGSFLIPECMERIDFSEGWRVNATERVGIYSIGGYEVDVADWKVYSLNNKSYRDNLRGLALTDSESKKILISNITIMGSEYFWGVYWHERCHFENPIGQYRENVIASAFEEAWCTIYGGLGAYTFERPEIVKL